MITGHCRLKLEINHAHSRSHNSSEPLSHHGASKLLTACALQDTRKVVVGEVDSESVFHERAAPARRQLGQREHACLQEAHTVQFHGVSTPGARTRGFGANDRTLRLGRPRFTANVLVVITLWPLSRHLGRISRLRVVDGAVLAGMAVLGAVSLGGPGDWVVRLLLLVAGLLVFIADAGCSVGLFEDAALALVNLVDGFGGGVVDLELLSGARDAVGVLVDQLEQAFALLVGDEDILFDHGEKGRFRCLIINYQRSLASRPAAPEVKNLSD